MGAFICNKRCNFVWLLLEKEFNHEQKNNPPVRTIPAGIAKHLESIKTARSQISDTEAINGMIGIMEVMTGEKKPEAVTTKD